MRPTTTNELPRGSRPPSPRDPPLPGPALATEGGPPDAEGDKMQPGQHRQSDRHDLADLLLLVCPEVDFEHRHSISTPRSRQPREVRTTTRWRVRLPLSQTVTTGILLFPAVDGPKYRVASP